MHAIDPDRLPRTDLSAAGASANTLSAERIAAAFIDACLLGVGAVKPGSVGFHRAGHRARALELVRGARAASLALTREALTIGERIRAAVGAMHAAVGTNTHLGTIVLVAPLVEVIFDRPPPATPAALAAAAAAALDQTTPRDTELVEAATRLVTPLAFAAAAFARDESNARLPLRAAMRSVTDQDVIARQYDSAYRDVLDTGMPRLLAARDRGRDWRWTTTEVYLAYLSRVPDTHVARDVGAAQASTLTAEAVDFDRLAARATDLQSLHTTLVEWDRSLKQRRIDPMTSADLTVCTLFMSALCKGFGEIRPAIEDPDLDG